jgi:lysophospholipase L1-like esterase
MPSVDRRKFMKTLGIVGGTALAGTGTAAGHSDDAHNPNNRREHHSCTDNTDDPFVGTWTASVVPPGSSGYSHTGFEDQTLRQIVHTSIGGPSVRIRLSNTFGDQSVMFDHVEIGLQDEGAAVVSGTNELVTFGGEKAVMIPSGAMVYSDPVPLSVDAEQDLAVSIHAPKPTGPATWHPLALQTSYLSDGGDAGTESGDSYKKELHSWYFLEGVDVCAEERNTSAIVTLGDSITDGFRSTPNTNYRYPDYLARRINDHPEIHRSVLNAGISGNRILHDSLKSGSFGTNALARLNRDVIAQPGVSDVIVLEGINDIGQYPPEVSAEQIIQGLKQIGIRCRAHGLNVYAGTLTPTRGAGGRYSSPTGEAKREIVNEFIRTGGFFDGVIDFDRAIQDPDQPDRMLPKFDSGDHLHPNDAGYRKMAQTVDLSLFKGDCHSGRSHRRHDHDNSSHEAINQTA